jgi:hypothetical protein
MSAGEGVESINVTAVAATEEGPDSNGAPGSVEEDLALRTLYVVNLPSASDELLIESLFEADEIASTQVGDTNRYGNL